MLSLVENLFVKKKFFARFALQSECCNFNQWGLRLISWLNFYLADDNHPAQSSVPHTLYTIVYIYWIIDNVSTLNFNSSLYTCPPLLWSSTICAFDVKDTFKDNNTMYQRAEQQCAKSTNVISFLCIYPFGDWCS